MILNYNTDYPNFTIIEECSPNDFSDSFLEPVLNHFRMIVLQACLMEFMNNLLHPESDKAQT
jgi:hypothetical protein